MSSITSFRGSEGLEIVKLPNNIKEIPYGAFWGCTSLVNISIPERVTSIGVYAFRGCDSLTSITIPSSVTSVGDYAFWNCSSLTSITIPDGVTSIGLHAFRDCTSLTSITIPFVGATLNGTSNTHFGYIFGPSDYVPTSLKSVVITGGSSIGEWAFEDCSNLTSITIPDSITSIGNYAFRGCTGLTYMNYNGTMAGWNNISKGYLWNFSSNIRSIICIDGTITL